MSIEKVKELLEVLKNTPYNEISYKEGDFELSLKREGKETVVQNVVNIPQEIIEEKLSETEYIKSPLVGAFYTASSPEAKPFVSIVTALAIVMFTSVTFSTNLIVSPSLAAATASAIVLY